MSFISNSDSLRTVDDDRGIELKVRSGGSDGTKSFQFVSTSGDREALAGFSARLEPRPRMPQDEVKSPVVQEVSTWKVMSADIPGFLLPDRTLDETIDIVREALLSYRALHGIGSEQTEYRVEISQLIYGLVR